MGVSVSTGLTYLKPARAEAAPHLCLADARTRHKNTDPQYLKQCAEQYYCVVFISLIK